MSEQSIEVIPDIPTPPDPWVAKMRARRASLVAEQGQAVEQFKLANQRVTELQVIIERTVGAIKVIDELLKPQV